MIRYRGIEYLELVSDSIMPKMFELFSSEWNDEMKDSICGVLLRVLESGGIVLGAYISEEEDPGLSDESDDDFTSVAYEQPEPEEKPYDWYIEDDEEPVCRCVVGICAVSAERIDNEYIVIPLLCVVPEYRRMGIGKGLFRRAVRSARTLDSRKLFINAVSDGQSDVFFRAVGCTDYAGAGIPSICGDDRHRNYTDYSSLFEYGKTIPLEFALYPQNADGTGMISIEEYQTMAGIILDSLPKEFFYQLNGGVVVRPEKKIHSKSFPGAPMFIMGEYTRSYMMGRMIYLYYGSFAAVYGNISRSEQREQLRSIIVHEFRHHMEWLSGTRELEDEDERGIRAYLMRFAKKNNKKNGSDGKKS